LLLLVRFLSLFHQLSLYNLASTLLCSKRSFPDVPSACKHATSQHTMQQHISAIAAKHAVASNANVDEDKHTIQLGVRTACCCYNLTTSVWQVNSSQIITGCTSSIHSDQHNMAYYFITFSNNYVTSVQLQLTFSMTLSCCRLQCSRSTGVPPATALPLLEPDMEQCAGCATLLSNNWQDATFGNTSQYHMRWYYPARCQLYAA
jgi:hypothetical protein